MDKKRMRPEWWDFVGMILTLDRRLLIVVPAFVAISYLVGKFG
jgi:hypothetical protein